MLPRIKRRNERERGGRNRQTDRLKQIQRLRQRQKRRKRESKSGKWIDGKTTERERIKSGGRTYSSSISG